MCARARFVVVLALRQYAAEHRDAGAQHVHGVRGGGQQFQRLLHHRGQAAQRAQARLVGRQFRRVGQLAVDQQMRHFLKFAVRGQIGDVVAAIMQIVAAVADGAERRVAGGRAGEGHGLLGFEGRCAD